MTANYLYGMTGNKTQEWLQKRRQDIQDANYSKTVQTAILDFLDAYNADNIRLKPPVIQGKDKRESTLSTSSRLSYASTLHRTAQHFHEHKKTNLLTCTADDLNRYANARVMGTAPNTKDEGLSQNTVHQNQTAWRSFYQFHQNHPNGVTVEVDPKGVTLVDRDETHVDERDIFDSDDIQSLRDATQNKRDRALLELLIYTGQRHNCLRQLTYDDVRPDKGESGVLYIPDSEGMKGSKGKRPLLGAQKAARDWRRAHPTQEDDDAYLTHIYNWSGHDDIEPGDHLSRQSFGRIPKRIADRAGVEKPTNPHQFRHYFCTTAIKDHGMSMDTVRHLLGHAADSRELERTYQHLVDDDHIENAELDMGVRDEKEQSLTPAQCPTCNEPLQPSWSVCPNCEAVFGPDAQRVKDETTETATQDALNAHTEREKEDLQDLLSLLRDSDQLNQLVALSNALSDEDDPFGIE